MPRMSEHGQPVMPKLPMRVLAGKKTFAFDWDGTVLDSMPIKLRTFSDLLAETLRPLLPASSADLPQVLRVRYEALSGKPRREIVTTVLREHGLDLGTVDFEAFTQRLGEINRRELSSAEVFPDALDFLSHITQVARAVYISSSVPQIELNAVVVDRLPAAIVKRLRGVLGSDGSFAKGPAHIERILGDTHCASDEVLFFGDDLADVHLCRQAGIECVLVDRRHRFADVESGALRVPDFRALTRELTEVEQP